MQFMRIVSFFFIDIHRLPLYYIPVFRKPLVNKRVGVSPDFPLFYLVK